MMAQLISMVAQGKPGQSRAQVLGDTDTNKTKMLQSMLLGVQMGMAFYGKNN